jgi:hypothetical protein
MEAAGPAPTWDPDAADVRSAVDFVDAALGLPQWRSLDIDLDGERVSLRRSDTSHDTPGGAA